jgi:Ala-tRNA(Pro) deacylase
MPAKKLKEFLDSEKVKYVSIGHSVAYTAQEIAASAHIPGQELAKTVVVKLDGEMVLAVLPATARVDLELLRKASGAKSAELARENEFAGICPGCELGAMPPFGNLYGLEVFVAQRLAEDDYIAFNAGTHTELIQMSYADFERLARPRVLKLSA